MFLQWNHMIKSFFAYKNMWVYFIFCLIYPESSDKTAETPGPAQSTQRKAKKRVHSASEVAMKMLECDQDINKIMKKKIKLQCQKLKLETALLKAECVAKGIVVESSESESDWFSFNTFMQDYAFCTREIWDSG